MFKCLGCNRQIPWDGKGMFSYTCSCGATIFYNETNGELALPFSLAKNLQSSTPLPHLNDLVGESSHTSLLKERVINELRSKGFIWMDECEQCKKNGTLKRKQEREAHLAVLEAESMLRRSHYERP